MSRLLSFKEYAIMLEIRKEKYMKSAIFVLAGIVALTALPAHAGEPAAACPAVAPSISSAPLATAPALLPQSSSLPQQPLLVNPEYCCVPFKVFCVLEPSTVCTSMGGFGTPVLNLCRQSCSRG